VPVPKQKKIVRVVYAGEPDAKVDAHIEKRARRKPTRAIAEHGYRVLEFTFLGYEEAFMGKNRIHRAAPATAEVTFV